MRTCTKCGVEQQESAYYKAGNGLRGDCKKCNSRASNARYHRDPEKRWEYLLGYHYGMTMAEYSDMLRAQGGTCAICGSLEPGHSRQRMHVDHDHQTGMIRGLLCNTCNRVLGLMCDNPVNLRAAADYLEASRVTLD